METKILRINMTSLTSTIEPVPDNWAYLGGRGLTSTIISEEVPPTCDPLGKNNKLVFAPGLLSGTAAANCGRLSAGFKSPLTGGIKESSAGGNAALNLVKLRFKAVIIEGMPQEDKWYSIHINKDGATIKEDAEYIGKGNYEVFRALNEKMGKKIGALAIGPAGEFKMTASNISVKDPDGNIRSHGRGGGGAVMGSKRLKYITIDDTGATAVTLADPEKFKENAKNFAKALISFPVTGEGLPKYGTNLMVNIINGAGAFPTKNFRYGQNERAEEISGEHMYDVIVSRNGHPSHGCLNGCIVKCSQTYNDKDGNYVTSGFEYETINLMGSNTLINDLDIVARCDWAMDDIGVDSIDTAVAIGVAMDADILPWGDGEEAYRLINEEIRQGTPLGRILGNGAGSVGKAYGVSRVPVVKNQAISAYDPRTIKGFGVTYATSPMGADHTAGWAVGPNLFGIGGRLDPLKNEGQVEKGRHLQIEDALTDSIGLCHIPCMILSAVPESYEALVEMINARYGLNQTIEEYEEMGKAILKTERAFNQGAGFTNVHDRLPEFFAEPLPPHNVGWDMSNEELDTFWNF
ncbi:MAG: aldehyde ferredoxin oxidoreductase C-terminal domain-containing protein [Pedobacter sp.]